MSALSTVMISAALVLAVDKPEDQAMKAARKELEGSWMVRYADAGEALIDAETAPVLIFSAEKVVLARVKVVEKKVTLEEIDQATYTLDPSKKPMHIDMLLTTGMDKGKSIRGLYQVKGSKLRICLGASNGERPKTF